MKRGRKDNKELHAERLKAEREIAIMEALAETCDRHAVHARETFQRPAFQGTPLEPHRQQDT